MRFHVKHLVLELIGAQETITDDLYDFCFSLFQDDFWKDHILETVFLIHTPYIQNLIEKGTISDWLGSNNDEEERRAFWLLRSVTEKIPDSVSEILEPYVEKDGEWPTRILNTLPWKLTEDSERMFQLRLQLASMGYAIDFIDWKSFCAKHPLRSIQLIDAVISNWNVDDNKETTNIQKGRLEKWYDQDSIALNRAVTKDPTETWDLLIPHLGRLTCLEINPYDYRLERWMKKRYSGQHQTEIARGVVELVMLAGQKLAVNNPNELIARTIPWDNSPSPIIQEILIDVYGQLPASHAEVGILWLLHDSSRFALGANYDEPEWQPAVRLIKRLSPYCSEKIFHQLEDTIVQYHAPDEKQMAEFCLKGWREGYFRHYWGQAQYFLLPVLDQDRIQPSTKALIQVLKRKFASYPTHRFLRIGRFSGGWVGSKLNPNLERISDRAWLEIVVSDKVIKGGNKEWIQNGPDNVLETSVRQFALSLQKMAKRDPQRFGMLALRFPKNIPSAYVSSILDGLAQTKPDNNTTDEEKDAWQPASVETTEAVFQKFRAGDDRETAMSFCQLISNRAEENWSDATIERLIHYACNHPDLKPGKLNLHCDQNADEASVETLFQNTINCVRGSAARAIERLLWHNYDWFDKLSPGLEALVHDPHPAVRMAATETLLPVLNINKDLAVKWFCQACSEDARVAAAHGGRTFFNYTVKSHFEEIKPIIQQMILSVREDVVKEGAIQVTASWLFHGVFEEELNRCWQGTIPQRKGVARASIQLLSDVKYSRPCQNLLIPLLNDTEKEVRDECFHIYHKTDFLYDDQLKPFMKEYIASKAFCDNPGRIVGVLKDTSGSLIPLAEAIFTICKIFSTTLKEQARDLRSRIPHDVSEILTVLLRLYEQASSADDIELANRCLDLLDMLFQNRVGIIKDLTKSMEQ